MTHQAEFDEEIVRDLVAEGLESLESASAQLQELATNPEDLSGVDSIFRCFHSIKGNTAMLGLTGISAFAHGAENALDKIRQGKRKATPTKVELLVEAVDLLTGLLETMDCQTGTETVGASHEAFLQRLTAAFEQDDDADTVPAAGEKQPTGEAGDQNPENARAASAGGSGAVLSSSLRVDVTRMDSVVKIAGELFHIDERLKHLIHRHSDGNGDSGSLQRDELRGIARDFDSAMERLYEQLLDIRKVPASQLTRPLERIVRDTCRKQNKRIKLDVHGADLRLDKQLLESLHDPLVHMVRNAADHGIESPADRRAAGKSEEGHLQIRVHDAEDTVVVTVADDGKGIDLEAVKAKAVSRGLVEPSEAEALTDDQLVQFIFHAGFSTAKKISDLSGRGVGLDVVMSNLRRHGGSIKTRTELGRGTTFELEMPKAGSPVVEGLVVRVGKVTYLLPLKAVQSLVAWDDIPVVSLPGNRRAAHVSEATLPLAHLDGLCESHVIGQDADSTGAIIENPQGRRCVLPVDEVVGRQNVLVVNIASHLDPSGLVTGAFILGNGSVGFAISVERLLESADAPGNAQGAISVPHIHKTGGRNQVDAGRTGSQVAPNGRR